MKSIRQKSIITGIIYLSMIPFSVLGILYIPNALIVEGDIGTTVANIAANQSLFHLAILSSLIVQIIQIFLVLALYSLLKVVSKTAAVLLLAFILPAVSISMLNDVNYLAVSEIIRNPEYINSFTQEQINGLANLFLTIQESGVMVAQIFWGLWLLPMGYLVYKSKFIPAIIGILLYIGGFGYLFDSIVYILNLNIGITISEYLFIGEVLLPLWLIFRSKSVESKYLQNYK